MNQLELLIQQENFDIIAVTETLPKRPDHNIHNFTLVGYTCLTDTKGRGVSLFVKNNMETGRLTKLEEIFSPSIICKASVSREESFILGLAYRSPNSTNEETEALNTIINQMMTKYNNERIILTGDLNFPEIDWMNEVCKKKTDHPAYKFLNTLQQNFLFQLIKEPTHHRPMQSPILIDLVITNDQSMMQNIHLLPPLGKSHHSLIQ